MGKLRPTPKPKTQKEAIEQLWDKVIGTNGDGLVEHFNKHIEEDGKRQEEMTVALNTLTVAVASLSGEIKGHTGADIGAKPSRKQINKQRVVEVAVIAVVLGGMAFGALLLWLGLIVPDDIRAIIQAARIGG
tara:strand:- start:163 stop:558 length:396 start_codon:yes stop_codon:yes gene_type:complete